MTETISQRVNALFAQYVAIERAQYECKDGHVDALGEQAFEVSAQIHAISDQTGNADFIASRILLNLMLENCWPELDRIEWDLEGKWHLALLESIAVRTTGAVRQECTKALATIGVTVPPEREDPFVARLARYVEDTAAYNASGGQGQFPYGALCDEIESGAVKVGSPAAALAALERLTELDCIGDGEGLCMVDAVKDFLIEKAAA